MDQFLRLAAAERTGFPPPRRATEQPLFNVESIGGANGFHRNPTILLVSPAERQRSLLKRMTEAGGGKLVAVYDSYPDYAQLPSLVELNCDAYIIDIDSDQDLALEVVETLCSRKPTATVMVYSALNDQGRMVLSMRAGAREFFSGLVPPEQLRDSLLRAAARNCEHLSKSAVGKTMVFWSAKGGSGVSTLAANFAVALQTQGAAPVLLADLNPQLGDISVLLGLKPRFTVADALQNPKRLDVEFLSTLVTEHHSGVSVIAAPDTYSPCVAIAERAVGKLLDVARSRYPWVVIDAGPSLGSGIESVFQMADMIYLVTQVDIPSLRAAQRFISYMELSGGAPVEVIVNRYDARRNEFNDERIAKALGAPPKWKVPNDYATAHRAANAGNMVIFEKSPVAEALHALARAACGKRAEPAIKKSTWRIFG